MFLKHLLKLCLLLCLLLCTFAACDVPTITINNPATTPSASAPTTDQGTPELNTWYQGGRGVEVRYEDWKTPSNNEDTVTIVRFDTRYVKLSVAYQPAQPLLMSQWMQQEKATAIINGGYFDEQNNATALVVANGQAFGTSYASFGGMLAVDAQGQVSLRSLRQQPYDANNERLQQATQSSPMLVAGGKATQFNADAANSRRSVVAIDRQGRLLLIASPGLTFSLGELEDLLLASDLSIEQALNLDGGASTGLYVNAGSQHVAIDSVARLPIVVIIKEK